MKYLLSVLILVCSLGSCKKENKTSSSSQDKLPQESFDWLLGNWQRVDDEEDGKQTYESWKKIDDSEYQGHGFTLQNQDTVWQERMKLMKTDSIWHFIVSGNQPDDVVSFEVVELDSTRFVSKNSTHDFPNIIGYKFSNNQINAYIADTEETMNIEFNFERITQ